MCDNCGKDAGLDKEYSCWVDSIKAEEEAMEYDFIKETNNHYCPECAHYDDDNKLIIDESRKDKFKHE